MHCHCSEERDKKKIGCTVAPTPATAHNTSHPLYRRSSNTFASWGTDVTRHIQTKFFRCRRFVLQTRPLSVSIDKHKCTVHSSLLRWGLQVLNKDSYSKIHPSFIHTAGTNSKFMGFHRHAPLPNLISLETPIIFILTVEIR